MSWYFTERASRTRAVKVMKDEWLTKEFHRNVEDALRLMGRNRSIRKELERRGVWEKLIK